MSTGSVGSAHCYRHPDRETGVRCVRCERPICPDCMRPASVGFHCPDDARAGARSIRAPRTSVGAKITQSPPVVTGVLVALNVVVYLVVGLQRPGTLRRPGGPLFYDWQLYPPRVHDGAYYQLLTSAFVHASLLHIAGNMLALILVGPALERLLGPVRFASVYLIGAVGGGALVYAFENFNTPTVGASGAIFAMFGACLVLVRRLPLDPQWLVATIVLNFVITFSVSGISQLGHVGGFVTGVLCAFALGGDPRSTSRLAPRLQVGGMTAVLVLAVVTVAVRTATYS